MQQATSNPAPPPPPSGPLALGSVQLDNSGNSEACPSDLLFPPTVTCYHATVTNCPNALDLGLTFGYEAPAGTPSGTIVLFSGGGGTMSGSLSDYATYTAEYVSQGYAVIETAWDSSWEDTTNGTTGSNVPAHSILAAGCRPATFLNYIFTQSSPFYASGGGRCAQGISGGSGAVAYSLASYGADAFLDKIELQSGPVFGDIQEGCEVPPPSPVTVCADSSGGVAPWCYLGGSQSLWSGTPSYSGSALTAVQGFTGDNSCGGAAATSTASNNVWKAMSIVNGASNTNFTYPNTSITAWLCAGSSNNSTEQGQFFYEEVGPTSTPLAVYAVSGCQGAEGVDQGNVPALSGDPSGLSATESDMISACHKTH